MYRVSRFREHWIAACLFLAIGVPAGAVPVTSCTDMTDGAVCTLTREMSFWYGTLTVVGAPASEQSFLSSTDHVSITLSDAINLDSSVDPRVIAGLAPLVLPSVSGIEWVLADPENLDANGSLLSSYAAAAASLENLFGPGTLSLGGVTSSNARYFMGSATILCNPGNPPVCADPRGEDFFLATGEYYAGVTYFEQNAVWEVVSPPTTVPEPGTAALFAVALGTLLVRRRRRMA